MNKLIENLILGTAAMALLMVVTGFAFAQITWTTPAPAKPERPETAPPPSRPSPQTTNLYKPYPNPEPYYRGNYEKLIKVDSGVKVTFGCVTEGTIKVNGWNRNEVRVFVADGTQFGFRVAQASPKSGNPVWIKVFRTDTKTKNGPSNECIAGNEIEVDVPLNAIVDIQGGEITTHVDSIKKAQIVANGCDISFRNVSEGITAKSNQGDIMVEGSEGPIDLNTTSGNVVVFEAGPSGIGDVFRASTQGGTITLQQLTYRQITVGSISGSVSFNGEILSGGSYSMSTNRGSIRLTIPANSSCLVNASYGSGKFDTEIPIKTLTENITSGPIKNVVGTMGKGGDSVLKLSSYNGSIGIKKQ